MTEKKSQIEELLAAAHINPNSFEAELGLLCHKWTVILGLDNVIDGLDHQIEAANAQQDLAIAAASKLPPSGD